MVEFTTTTTDADLEQILELQRANRSENLSPDEVESEGFVSARHDLALLRDMNTPHAHVIAKENNKVVGYTLALVRSFDVDRIPILDGLLGVIEAAEYNGASVQTMNFIIMGQVCVAKEYRGKGVFGGLYAEMRETLSPHFECIVTSVSTRNPRSLRAHAKVGFEVVHKYSSHGEDWRILLWKW